MHVVVTEVKVRSIPFRTPDGDRLWDLTSGPDLYYETYGPEGTCLYTSAVTSDVRPSDLPISLGGPVGIEAEGPHLLRLLDEDLVDSEVVARVAFEPRRLAEAGQGPSPPQWVQFEDRDTTLWVSLRWGEGA